MKQTLGQYLNFEESQYPLTLNFNGFYYYENPNHDHILIHLPTSQKCDKFLIPNNVKNVLEYFNKVFNLSLDELMIYDKDEKYRLHATKDTEFVYVSDNTIDGFGVTKGYITFTLDWLCDTSKMSPEEKERIENQFKLYVNDLTLKSVPEGDLTDPEQSEQDQARPPTE